MAFRGSALYLRSMLILILWKWGWTNIQIAKFYTITGILLQPFLWLNRVELTQETGIFGLSILCSDGNIYSHWLCNVYHSCLNVIHTLNGRIYDSQWSKESKQTRRLILNFILKFKNNHKGDFEVSLNKLI